MVLAGPELVNVPVKCGSARQNSKHYLQQGFVFENSQALSNQFSLLKRTVSI